MATQVEDATQESFEDEKLQIDTNSKIEMTQNQLFLQLFYCKSLQMQITQKYSNINELWNHNPEGTVNLLRAKGGVYFGKKKIVVQINQDGTNNTVTWSQYKVAIDKFLHDINDNPILEKARDSIAKIIHKKHFVELPFWPTVEEKENKRLIKLDETGEYEHMNLFIVWGCFGHLTVKDIRKSKLEFYTECSSDNLSLKVMRINHTKLRKIEALCGKDISNAKEKADEYTNRQLTFEDDELRGLEL